MNLRSIVVVALRLLALDSLFRAALELSPKVFQFLKIQHRVSAQVSAFDEAFPWLLLFGLVGCAILFWIFAPAVARLVVRAVPEEICLGSVTLADLYSVAFVGFGLYCIGTNLPQVLAWIHYLFKTAASTPGDAWKEQISYEVVGVFVQFAVGVLLLLKGRAWALGLARRDSAHDSQNKTVDKTAAQSLSSEAE